MLALVVLQNCNASMGFSAERNKALASLIASTLLRRYASEDAPAPGEVWDQPATTGKLTAMAAARAMALVAAATIGWPVAR